MASKRRRTLPDDLDLDEVRALPGAAMPQAPFHERPSSVSDENVQQRKAALGLKEKVINMSIYLLPDDHRRLRRLAADEDTSIQALVLDGIDHVLGQRGQGLVTRWETRRKPRG